MTGMTASIYVSLGQKRYVGGIITDTNGKNISGATFTVALGTDSVIPPAAAAFGAADVNTTWNGNLAQRQVLKLVDTSVTAGTYYVWVKCTDAPEIEPLQVQGPITVA